jgi:hypothetical protein
MNYKYHLCKSEKEEVQEQNPEVLHIGSPLYQIYNFLQEWFATVCPSHGKHFPLYRYSFDKTFDIPVI